MKTCTSPEFSRGEPAPQERCGSKAVISRHRPDPLAYDTSDLISTARQMALDALANRNDEAVLAELDALRARYR